MSVIQKKQFDYSIKVIVIGNSSVGKTCIVNRYANKKFSPSYITTIGIDFCVKYIKIDEDMCKLLIWDTAGQEKFRSITMSYFKGVQICLIIYDICDYSSFESVKSWIDSVSNVCNKDVQFVIIGNKCDETIKRKVSYSEGKMIAEKYDVPFFECSAKNNINIDEMFNTITKTCLVTMKKKEKSTPIKPSVSLSTRKKKNKCCIIM